MYIPFDKIFNTVCLFFPIKSRKFIRDFGENLRVRQNLKYISKNKKIVLEKLKQKVKNNEKINVAFYIYDETKWKAQSVYDLMEESKIFVPHIFVSKNCSSKTNFNYQTKEELKKVYDFFKNKNMRVSYAYDFEKDDYIAFEDMNIKPDIIFYCHPWYIYKTQGPVVCSKFSLTYYIPYFLATSVSPIEYYLRFHKYIETHFVPSVEVKNYYSLNMENKGKNLSAAGHPMLDYFYLNKDKNFENKNYVIYAPHWSVDENNNLEWGTFLWSGKYILEFAKKHPEFNWIFKPHPCLKNYLNTRNIMNEKEINDYWKGWQETGKVIESGDYLQMFMESTLMITDCGSFETEYFMSQKPLIHLKRLSATPFNPAVEKMVSTSYEVTNINELKQALELILIQKQDPNKEKRKQVLKQLGLEDSYAAKNILDEIKNTLGVLNG